MTLPRIQKGRLCSACKNAEAFEKIGKHFFCLPCLLPRYDYTNPQAIEGSADLWMSAAKIWRIEEQEILGRANKIKSKLHTLTNVEHTEQGQRSGSCGCASCQQRLAERMIARVGALRRIARETLEMVSGGE